MRATVFTDAALGRQAGRFVWLAVDTAGSRLFVADQFNNRVLIFDTTTITDGMNVARGEAIRRNVPVQLQLTTAGGGTGAAWTVSELPAPSGTGAVVQRWSAAEGASSAQMAPAGGGILTFNALGRVFAKNPINNSAALLQVDVTSSNAASDPALRPMRVVVGNGGQARMCDPQLAQPDPRAC